MGLYLLQLEALEITELNTKEEEYKAADGACFQVAPVTGLLFKLLLPATTKKKSFLIELRLKFDPSNEI